MPTGTFNGTQLVKNITFDQPTYPPVGEFTADGQLLIGYATTQSDRVAKAGNITSASLSVTYVDPNIVIETNGGGAPVEEFVVDAGVNPVTASGTGQILFTGENHGVGSYVVAVPSVVTHGVGPNTMAVSIQIASDQAASSIDNIGLASFDSTDFTVDANGFVALAGGGAVQTLTADSGGALVPTLGNFNILGRSGSKTAGSGSTITVNSPPYSDQAGSTTVTLNSGSFATNAITLTTPATAGLLDGDLLEFVATNGVLVIQLAATQVAHLGSVATSAAGTITGTATGDSISLRYQASTNDWWATSSVGVWVLA